MTDTDLTELTADIVAAYVGHHSLRPAELPDIILAVHASLAKLGTPEPEAAPELKPAVSIKKSITDDYIISLEDGRKFKSMKRYLSKLGMTPGEYRTKWGLPRDYPMVAPGYAAKRSELAKAAGLGAKRRAAAAPEPARASEPVEPAETPKRGRGRPKKAA